MKSFKNAAEPVPGCEVCYSEMTCSQIVFTTPQRSISLHSLLKFAGSFVYDNYKPREERFQHVVCIGGISKHFYPIGQEESFLQHYFV